MSEQAVVRCPKCNRKQPVRAPDSIYYCKWCECQFDSDPNEGGDFSDHNPAARLELEERARERQAQRRGR